MEYAINYSWLLKLTFDTYNHEQLKWTATLILFYITAQTTLINLLFNETWVLRNKFIYLL